MTKLVVIPKALPRGDRTRVGVEFSDGKDCVVYLNGATMFYDVQRWTRYETLFGEGHGVQMYYYSSKQDKDTYWTAKYGKSGPYLNYDEYWEFCRKVLEPTAAKLDPLFLKYYGKDSQRSGHYPGTTRVAVDVSKVSLYGFVGGPRTILGKEW